MYTFNVHFNDKQPIPLYNIKDLNKHEKNNEPTF